MTHLRAHGTPDITAIMADSVTRIIVRLMALSGLFFVFFLLFHSYGNLKMFLGAEVYNDYAKWLHEDAFVPIFPHGGFLLVFRAIMILLVLVHIVAALNIWVGAKKARKSGYVVKKSAVDAYAARTMRFTGVFLVFLIVFHLLHFTTKTIQTGFDGEATPYQMMLSSFQNPWIVIVYLIFVALVVSHVGHGFWSAFQTMGWVRKGTRTFMVWLSGAIAALIFVMFMITPLAIAVGWIA